jgi:hypothetical protein
MILSIACNLIPLFVQGAGPSGPTASATGAHAGPSGPTAPSRGSFADAVNELRTYDLSSIAVERQWKSSTRTLLPMVSIDDGGFHDHQESGTVFSADEVMEFLYQQYEEEIEYEGRGMWGLDGDRMAVRAPASLHQEIGRTLAALNALTSSHTELTIDVLVSRAKPLGDSDMSGLVSLEAAENWMMNGANASERERYVVKLATGHVSRLDVLNSTPVVLDWDVEIAQGAAVHDPATTVLSLGRRLQLAGSPTERGLNLSFALLQCELAGPPETRANRQHALLGSEAKHDFIDAPSNVQHVTTWDRTLTCNSSLDDGQALVLRFDLAGTDGENYHEAIVIRRTGARLQTLRELPSSTGRSWTVIDSTAVSPPRVRLHSGSEKLVSDWFVLIALGLRIDDPLIALIDMDGPDLLYELLESGRGGLDDLQSVGPWIFARQAHEQDEEEAERSPVPSYAEVLSASLPDTESVNLGLELRRGGPQGEVLRRAGIALRTSRSNVISLGVERTYEYGYDVEVAQHAAAGDPETRVSFDGVLCKLGLTRQPDGGLRLDVEGIATALIDDRRFEYAGHFLERAIQPSFDRLQVDESLHIGADETTRRFVLGNQFEGAGSQGLTLVVTVRR